MRSRAGKLWIPIMFALMVIASGGWQCFDLPVEEPMEPVGADSAVTSLVFIHHSVGSEWIANGGLSGAVSGAGISFFDIHEGDGWFGNNTFPWHFPTTFTTYFNDVVGWELSGGQHHGVVMFKSCFPSSVIWSDNELNQFKGYYNQIMEVFQAHPEVKFIALSPPPYANNGEAPADAITRGREFAWWLVNVWQHGADNVKAVDFAGFLNGDPGFTHARTAGNAAYFYLRDECEMYPDNPHPTAACMSTANGAVVQAATQLLAGGSGVEILEGLNLLALPAGYTDGVAVSTIAEQVDAQGGQTVAISWWEPYTATWQIYDPAFPFLDFVLNPGDSFFLETEAASVWTPSEPFLAQSAVSVPMIDGYTLVSFPTDAFDTVSDLAADMEQAGCPVTEISRWEAADQSWETYNIEGADGDFQLAASEGCFLLGDAACSYEILP